MTTTMTITHTWIGLILFALLAPAGIRAGDSKPALMELTTTQLIQVLQIANLAKDRKVAKVEAERVLDMAMVMHQLAENDLNKWLLANSPDTSNCLSVDLNTGAWVCKSAGDKDLAPAPMPNSPPNP